ncbi:MAG: thymidylate synthase [Candidatus Bathyarchaeia archaeon]
MRVGGTTTTQHIMRGQILKGNYVVVGLTNENVWKEALRCIRRNGEYITDPQNLEKTQEVLNLITSILKPSNTLPRAFSRDTKINDHPHLLEGLVRPIPGFSPGTHLWEWALPRGRLNQIEDNVTKVLRNNLLSRRAVALTFHPGMDSEHILNPRYSFPAIQIVDFKYREGSLHLTAYLRSCDIYSWWPINVVQAYRLLKKVGEKLDLSIGTLTLMISSAHVKARNLKRIETILV